MRSFFNVVRKYLHISSGYSSTPWHITAYVASDWNIQFVSINSISNEQLGWQFDNIMVHAL